MVKTPKLKLPSTIKKYTKVLMPLSLGIIAVLIPIIYLASKNSVKVQAAESMEISSNSTQIQIDVANRYRAVIQKGDTTDFIIFSDRAQNDSSPNATHEFRGPCIIEGGVTYCLRDDENRLTYVLEATTTRIKVRVEGQFANEASSGYLAASSGGNVFVQVDYTFTNDGVFVENETDFKGGVALDADSGHNGYEWLGIYADNTDAAFDDTGNIIYGNGTTEGTTSTDGGEFANTNYYVVLPGTGSSTYQDAYIGIMNGGWYGDSGGVREWHWDENETGTQDSINAQQQNYTASGQNTAMWFFHLLPETDVDTETERELIINAQQSYATLTFYGRGTAGSDPNGDAYNRREGVYMIDADSQSEAKYGISGSRYHPGYKFKNYRKDEVPEEISLNGEQVARNTWSSSVKPVSSALFLEDLIYSSTLENAAAVTSPDIGSAGTWGGTASTGVYGNGVLVDGNNDDTYFPLSGNVDTLQGTIEFWYINSGSNRPNMVVFSATDATISSQLAMQRSGNTPTVRIDIGGSNTSVTPAIDIFDGKWHHLMFAYDTVSDVISYYIDGIAFLSDFSLTMSTLSLGSNSLMIGMEGDGSGNTANGVFDEFRIYSSYLPSKIAYGGDTSETDEYLGDSSNNYTLDFDGLDTSGRGEYLFLASDTEFSGINVTMATKGVETAKDSSNFTWEYWNGTGWSTLTVTEQDWGSSKFINDGNFYFTPPVNWTEYSMLGTNNLYYIRGSMNNSDSFQTFPVEGTIKTDILTLQHYGSTSKTDETYYIPAEFGEFNLNKGSSPTAVWMMDDQSGATAQDSTEYNNDLTVSGATWATDTGSTPTLRRRYLSFDGVNDLLSKTNDGDFNFGTGSFTFTGWFKHNDTISGTDTILAHFGTAGYKLYMNSSGQICFGIDDDSTWSPDDEACSSTNYGDYSDNTWHHFGAVMDDAEDTITLYIDNIQVAQKSSLSSTGTLNTSSTLYVGMDSNGSSNPWHGDLDQVVLYSYARTATQIGNDYTTPQTTSLLGSTGTSPHEDDLVSWWRMDEQGGQTVNDNVETSGNSGNRGTTSGSETSDPTWNTQTNCKYNGCLEFDGSDDVVTITDANSISFDSGLAAGFTVGAWIYADTDGEGNVGQIFHKGTNNYLRVANESGTNLDVEAGLALGGSNATLSVSGVIETAGWYHVAMSYTDDADDEISIWINGKVAGTSTNGSGAPSADANALSIGGTTTANFDGRIDDFVIYSAELLEQEMEVVMNANSGSNFGVGVDQTLNSSGDSLEDTLGWWKLDDNTGTSTILDSGSFDYTGTINGTMTESDWIKGKYGSALDFDGSDDDISIGTFSETDGLGAVSVSAWVKPAFATTTANDYYIFSNGRVNIRFNQTQDDFTCQIVTGAGSSNLSSVGVTFDSGQWQHLVCIYDGTNHKIYWDGMEVGATTHSGTFGAAGTSYLGASTTGSNSWLGGLDDIRVYAFALTQDQIAYLYNEGEPFGWWHLDDCSGTTAYDRSINQNNGTITIGTGGTNATVGSCNSGNSDEAWNNGTDGKYNGSLSFDGTDDSVSVTSANEINFNSSSQDFTFMAWVQRATTGATHTIISKEDADNDGYRLLIDSSNNVICSVNSIDITSSSTISDTEWHHVACTVDRDGTGQVYIDGIANGATQSISSATMATTADLVIGARSYTTTNYFNGLIDDVRLYNYQLSKEQLNSAMNFGRVSFGFN